MTIEEKINYIFGEKDDSETYFDKKLTIYQNGLCDLEKPLQCCINDCSKKEIEQCCKNNTKIVYQAVYSHKDNWIEAWGNTIDETLDILVNDKKPIQF